MQSLGGDNRSKNKDIANKIIKLSKEEIINQAIKFHINGNIEEASKYYQYCLSKGIADKRVLSNYGIILKNLGKLSEAESLLRKAIQLNPDFADGYSNLGRIQKDLYKLHDAEFSTRKAIELNPNLAEAYNNLGNILRELGNLSEAEISTLKAIELNPNIAEAHNNLGNIQRDLGNLSEAEISLRKAIQINPDFHDAYSNLGVILQDLGKLKELLIMSSLTLKLRKINDGLKLLVFLRIAITNVLQNNSIEASLSLEKIKNLISKGVEQTIKNEQNRKYILTFFRFLTSLNPILEKEHENCNLNKIPHFGESHCLSFAHQNLKISFKSEKIQPVLITGAKAWHFANEENNKWKDSLIQQIKNHVYNDKVFISFGEIDCRKNEGIITHSIKENKNIKDICEKTINGYLNHMENTLSSKYSKRYYFGIPAPNKKEATDERDIERIKLIKIYNLILKNKVLSMGSYFLDVYEMTSTINGVNNEIHMCDDIHLSPKCLSILFEKHLYEPKRNIC